MRTLLILLITLAGIIASFSNAFYGLLLYVFYSIGSPLELSWGQLAGTRLSFIVAGVVISTAIIQKQDVFLKNKTTLFCVIFLMICFTSLLGRTDASPENWDLLWTFTRIIIMTIVSAALINDAQKLKTYILAVAVCTGILGAYYGFFGLMAGSTYITGPGGSTGGRFGDNNAYAVWLNTSLPFIYYAGANLKKKSWRIFSRAIFLGNTIAVLLTFSRAGFIVLLITLTMIFLRMKQKTFFFILMPTLLVLLFFLMPVYQYGQYDSPQDIVKGPRFNVGAKGAVDKTLDSYTQRLSTIKQYEKESSAVSRMYFWGIAIKMADANPIFGVGFMRYIDSYNAFDETHGLYGRRRAVHNTYLEVLADTGYIGFLVFITLIISVLVNASKFARFVKINDLPDREEFLDYAYMIRVSLLAFFLGGTFVLAILHDLFWVIIVIAMAMANIVKITAEKPAVVSTEEGQK